MTLADKSTCTTAAANTHKPSPNTIREGFILSSFRFLAPILCLLLFTACSTYIRQWELLENVTQTPQFNSGRMILPPDSDCSNIELEITRSYSGTRFYVNLLSLQAPPLQGDPTRTYLEIVFEQDEKPWIVHPWLFSGGQRLLLPDEVADALIDALMMGKSFTISIGRSTIFVIPDQFCEEYTKLISICL